MPDFAYIRKELLRNGVTKNLILFTMKWQNIMV